MSSILVSSDVERPEIDTRSYRIIRLDNDLEALLVHDSDTDKASAALDVHVGHLSDPRDAAGLAHFCEHLLFMGTEKYPKENDYSEFLSSHNGSSNAYTSTIDTNYFFDVGYEYLEPALDRFSQFFICPLFLESCKDRELLAVDSENKKNLQNDMWRAYQLEKSLSNPEHVYSKFGTGNLETLKTIPEGLGHDVRGELLKFHKKFYSANQMKLVLLGRDSLDDLEKLAISKFSAVTNKKVAAPYFQGDILRAGHELGSIYTFKPVKEVRNLELCFPIPECDVLWNSQPSHYISHLIGHEGQGSILSYLKDQGWVLYLGAGGSDASPGTDLFKINMELTLSGSQNWEQIIQVIFAYINLLKMEGIQEWIFDELRLISEAQFRFQERQPASRFTSGTAIKMHSSIDKRFILGTSVPREYRPEEIQKVMDAINYTNFRVALALPGAVGTDKAETYYGTEYRLDRLSGDLLYKCSPEGCQSIPELRLPMKNDFIPENFGVDKSTGERGTTQPSLVKQTPFTRVWHKKDDTFLVPKANYLFLVRNPTFRQSAETAVLTKLFVELLKDDMNEYAYNADIAGLQYAMEPTVGGVTLNFSGYNDKMDVLIEKVVSKMKYLHIDEERFNIEKDRLARDLNNFDYEAPYQQVSYYSSFIQTHVGWSKEEQVQALATVALDRIRIFAAEMFAQFHIEVLAHGNVTKEETLATSRFVENLLKGANPKDSQSRKAVVLLKTKSVPNDPYEQAVLDCGYQPYFVPVLDHAMINLDKLSRSCSTAVEQYSGLIVTSQRSVEAIGQVLPQLGDEQRSSLFGMPIYTVGPATHKAIESLGFHHVLGSESGNGDSLASYILDRRPSNELKPLFFPVGDKRRDIISRRMSEAGTPLEEMIVYETVTAATFENEFARTVKEAGPVDWMVFFSPAGADVALDYIKRSNNATRLATIGPTTEDYLVTQWNIKPSVVSPKPDAESLVRALFPPHKAVQPLSEQDTRAMCALWLPVGSHSTSRTLKDPSNTNSCIEYLVQFGSTSDVKLNAMSRLFAQICSEPTFNQLRTVEQLGYIVASGPKILLTSNGFRIIVQSEKNAEFLAVRIETFFDYLQTFLLDMDDAAFEKHKISVVDKLNEKMKNLSQETKRYWSRIISGLYNFDDIEEQTLLTRSLTKDNIYEFFMTNVHYKAVERRHLSMTMIAQSPSDDTSTPLSKTEKIEDIQQFKAKCEVMYVPIIRLDVAVEQISGSKL